jgi:Na+/proline symporter
MVTAVHYILLIGTLGFFGYVGYNAANRDMDSDTYLSARGTQNWVRIGLSLFASGMGIWILFGPSEVGYYGGFWDVVDMHYQPQLLSYFSPMSGQ